jgi:hypothetical protein
MPAEVVGSGLDGTFLVAYEGLTDGTDEYVQVIRIRSPLSGPAFNHRFVSVGDIEDFDTIALPDAPQKGSSVGIEVNDRRALDAVWWNNELWFTTTIDPAAGPNAGEATAHWFKFHAPNSGGVTLADQGDIGGEDIAPNTSTFFPAITMNTEGHVKFGFSASAPSIYAGAYATGRLHHDPPGTVRASETLKAGLAPYFRTHGGSRNRWGDYSGISLDPTDDNWVWVFNEYAETRGGPSSDPTENGRWGTAWGLGKFE